jgi:hypothetical protein
VQSLCASYHWPLSEALKLTVPQVVMLNHAAWAEHENGQRRYEAKRKWEEERDRNDPKLAEYGGRRLSEVMQDQKLAENYLSDWGAFQ